MNTPAAITFIQPPHMLQPDVVCFMVAQHQSETATALRTAPNAAPGMVFHHMNGQPGIDRIATRQGDTCLPSGLLVFGAGAEPSMMHFKAGSYTVIQVILKPHALNSLLQMDAAALANHLVAVEDVASTQLSYQLMETGDIEQQIDLLSAFLIRQLAQAKKRDALVEESLRLIHADVVSMTVRQLIDHLSVSERQFQRRFKQVVGMTPQSYMRVKRFNHALRCITAGQYDRLTDLAHALHYHDQSHFIRDIKTFTGQTPRQLLQNGALENIHSGYVFSLDDH